MQFLQIVQSSPMSIDSYNQPEKEFVRETVWLNATGVLTKNRWLAPLVREDELADILDYALRVLQPSDTMRSEIESEFENWLSAFRSSVGDRKAHDLRVLYLSGPEPLNDLEEMLAHGISPHNVWAVEGGHREFAAALQQLRASGTSLKIHPGGLAEFLDSYNSTFDIIYLDACGPFVCGKPNTLNPLLSLLLQTRLEPLSVLITSFAELPVEQVDRYAKLMTSYFRFRHRDLPKGFWESGLDPAICAVDARALEAFIREHPGPFYSDFITRMIVDLARSWFPNCRALANKDIATGHAAARDQLNRALAAAEHEPNPACPLEDWVRTAGDLVLNPSGYPILSFLRALKKLEPTDPLVGQLGNLKVKGQEAHRLIAVASLLEKVVEGHWGILSDILLRAIKLSWFDSGNHFSCDVPLPNLLINSLLGIYGRPYYPNPRATKRLSYKAKETTMYTDLLTMDQCRYFFDWFPLVQAAPDRFRSVPFQIIARCILDRMGRADWTSESHPLRGSAVAGFREIPAAEFYDFAPRRLVG